MKDTTSNMVAPLNPLGITDAQIIRIFIQTHVLENGRWNLNAAQVQAGSAQY